MDYLGNLFTHAAKQNIHHNTPVLKAVVDKFYNDVTRAPQTIKDYVTRQGVFKPDYSNILHRGPQQSSRVRPGKKSKKKKKKKQRGR